MGRQPGDDERAGDSPPALAVDPDVRLSRGGTTLLGGSPLRLVRLTEAGVRAYDELTSGEVPASGPAQKLARHLLDTGMAHPRPTAAPFDPGAVALVVPVRDDAAGLAALLAAEWVASAGQVVVVDDGSEDREVARVAEAAGAELRSHVVSGGPAAARNTGWRATSLPVVAFVDADCLPEPGWLDRLLVHLADPDVVAVAPAVRSGSAAGSLLGRYERHRSPLWLGDLEARVAPQSRIPYVPGAALVVTRAALERIAGFDEALRVGEDVDLIWRLAQVGSVRYEPQATAVHRPRTSYGAWLRQRFVYGSSAAALDRRHPGAVAPAVVNAWSAGSWALVAMGGRRLRLAGVGVAAASAAALMPRLRGRVDEPAVEAARLGGLGHLFAGRMLAAAVRRAWLPVAAAGALLSRRARRALAVALVVPALLDWSRSRPAIDPVRWTALSVADDAAYCAGVWAGCHRSGSWRALRPRFTGIVGATSDDPPIPVDGGQ